MLNPKVIAIETKAKLGKALAVQMVAALKKAKKDIKHPEDRVDWEIDNNGKLYIVLDEHVVRVDQGRKPAGSTGHKIPIVNLLAFLKAEGFTPFDNVDGGLNGLAYAMQASIAEKGIEAHKFIKRAVYKFFNSGDFDKIIEEAFFTYLDLI